MEKNTITLQTIDGNFENAGTVLDINQSDLAMIRDTADTVATAINPLTAIGCLARQALYTYGLASVSKRRFKTIEYVANTEVMREQISAEVRLSEIKAEHSWRTLYIERSFESECERIIADRDIKLAEIDQRERVAIEKLRAFVETRLAKINSDYSLAVKDQMTLTKLWYDFCRKSRQDTRILGDTMQAMAMDLCSHPERFSDEQTRVLAQTVSGMATNIASQSIRQFISLQSTLDRSSRR